MSARGVAMCGLAGVAAIAAATAPPAGGQSDGGPGVRIERVADKLTVPVHLAQPDDGTGRLFVVDQIGQIRVIDAGGGLRDEPFLDLSDAIVDLDSTYDERGLLGLAFHPEYRENGRFFVYYSAPAQERAPPDWDHTSHLSEFRVSQDDPDRADPDSERIVMQIDQPFSNHNGGHILFGADGYLFVPLGDGGSGGDIDGDEDLGRPEGGNAQTPSTLLGSVLRIDVDGEQPYGIPPDNPFAGGDGDERPETWAYGLRNPFGLSRDLENGDLYAADAGQALYEEINRIREGGGNFGWNIREGVECFDPDDFQDPPDDCPETGADGSPLIPPALVYQRSPERGSVVVPGVRYRGEDIEAFKGHVVFGDYSRIRFVPQGVLYLGTLDEDGDEPGTIREIAVENAIEGQADGTLGRFLLAVMQDLDGEMYALTSERGGPSGTTGEVLALRAPGDPSGTPWWVWLLVGAGVATVAVVAGWLLSRRRGAER